GVEGRPRRRLRRGGLRRRQGHPRPDDGGPRRGLPVVRLRDAQGLQHPGAPGGPRHPRALPGAPVLLRQRPCGLPVRGAGVSAEDLERYETDMELQLYREYRDVVRQFEYVVETERRFYLANGV